MGISGVDDFAAQWVEAWNSRDLDSLLSHYSEDVEFQSPVAARLLGEPSGTIRGKMKLREYFSTALAAFPGELEVRLLGVYRGVDSLVVHFEAKGRRGAEVMELTDDGLVRRALAHV
jgi:ketosteroid isomerase-like protein